MGKPKPEMEVTEYRMTIHFGICAGPIDLMKRILVGEKIAWEGIVTGLTEFSLRARNLFGGVKKEGGVEGAVVYLPGEADQLLPDRINTKYGLTADEMPAYRGIASAYFTEEADAGRAGFYWSANSPYLRGVWITIQRLARGLADAYAGIPQFNIDEFEPEIDSQREGGVVTDYSNDTEGRYMVARSGSTIMCWTDDSPEGAPNWTRTDVYDTPQSVAVSNGYVFTSYQLDGFINVYGANDGNHKATITTTHGGGNCAVFACPASTDGIGSGGEYNATETYVVRHGNYISLCKGSGSSWSEVSEADGHNWLSGTDCACLSPHGYYVNVDSFLSPATEPVVWYYEIDDDTLQAPVVRNLVADFAPGELIAAIGYSVDQDVVVILGQSGGFYVYNRDLSVLLRSSVGAAWSIAINQARGSMRMFSGPDTVTFITGGPAAQPYLIQYNISTAAMILYEIVNDIYDTNMNSAYTWWATNDKNDFILVGGASGVAPVQQYSIPPITDVDANPAHIIYESMTHKTWGMGASPLAIDKPSFEAAAVTLYGERFGLSLIWLRQTSVEAFVQEIIDHIEATLFLNPRTGLLTLKLIRNDYVIEDLKVFDTTNSKITGFKRKLWGETTNEIVASFTSPANEEEETVIAQDPANIAIQGDIVSSGRNYYAVRTSRLAMTLAQRDCRVASAPLASCDIEVNREAWDLLPGDCVVIVSPEDNVTQMVMRVGPIDYGKAGDPKIKASLVEDIFSLATAEFDIPPESEWVDPSEQPSPLDYAYAFTMPYFMAVNMLDPVTTGQPMEYPTVYAAVLAAEDGFDTADFELIGELTDSAGNVYLDSLGTRDITSRAELEIELPQEVTSVILTLPRTQGEGPGVGGLVVIGDGAEEDQEIGLVTAVSAVSFTIKRGALDTTPKVWPVGSPIWFVNSELRIADDEARSAAEELTYLGLPRTSLGILDAGEATSFDTTMTERPWLPSRPSNVKIEGQAWGELDARAIDPMDITWNHRNRLTEDAQILGWDDAGVTPEAGTAYIVRLTAMDGTHITDIAAGSGTSYSLAHADFGIYSRAHVAVYAERDGLVSLQGHSLEVIVADGYGYAYGYNYGGA